MIGRRTARIRPASTRWLHQVWGDTDIHTRQKWTAVWPLLTRWPLENVTLLDAGCGFGAWSLEIAARRPGWKIVGVDLDSNAIKHAEERRKKLGLNNVRFIETDFLNFHAPASFDIVISISSIHYAFESGQGTETFSQFESWLKPQARLILYAPRSSTEAPFAPWKFGRRWYDYFTANQLSNICAKHGLYPEHLSARVGRLGAIAKEIHWSPSPALRLLCYPLTLMLTCLDQGLALFRHSSSVFWLLIARKPKTSTSRKPQNVDLDDVNFKTERGSQDSLSEEGKRLEHQPARVDGN